MIIRYTFLVLSLLFISVLQAQDAGEKQDIQGDSSALDSDAEGQSRDSQAMDATATQWSFQMAYQWMPDYYEDEVNGAPRPSGLDNYLQLRVVAPVPLKSMTILPRLTIR